MTDEMSEKGLGRRSLGRFLPVALIWVAAPAPLYIWVAVWLALKFN